MRPVSGASSYVAGVNKTPSPSRAESKTPLQKSEDTKAAIIAQLIQSGSYQIDTQKLAQKIADTLV